MGLWTKLPRDRGYEILGICLLSLTVFLFFALVSRDYQGILALDDLGSAFNVCGRPGSYVAGVLYVLLGNGAHVLYVLTCVWALMLFRHRPLDRFPLRLMGLVLVAASTAGFLHLKFATIPLEGLPGGVIGAYVAHLVVPTFLRIGSYVIVTTLGFVGVLLASEFLFVRLFRGLYFVAVHVLRASLALYQALREFFRRRKEHLAARSRQMSVATQVLRGSLSSRSKGKSSSADSAAETEPGRSSAVPLISAEVLEEKPRELSRIRVVTQRKAEEPLQDEIPFDAVAEENQHGALGGKPSELALPGPVGEGEAPAEPVGTAPEDVHASGIVVIDGLAVKSRETRHAPPKPAMPRRKASEIIDELPPDYVYPRRYTKPSLEILDNPPPSRATEGLADQLRKTSVLLEKALETFGIEARVTDVTRGPTITRFELEPAPGIKVSRFLALADDLALALKAHGVRVEAPIPGKGRVGIELPNSEREPVMLRELIESRTHRRHGGRLVLALGKDIAGDVIAADLTTMPHLLIAGATGTGKTVCVKSLLASLLFMNTPEQLQLMLVDPKMVELSIFNDIPHLITPVVTDPKKAAAALNWLIVEMEERYRLFAQLRVRNIEVYNESVENGEIEMADAEGDSTESMDIVRKLPYIVCVIDELADLMMLARAEVEDAIMRLAQLARAVGIHLIIATQRPSVNVLTGVIKANFPVRVSFQVSSRVDSRCILDEIGAERLIGRGDMLYLPAGRATPTRIQGAFVSDHEMESLIAYLKTQAPPQYRDEIENYGKTPDQLEDLVNETDDLFDDAVRVVLETGQASISMVQRRLRVGYTRAARLIDMMEVRGIVGPHLGSKAREILVDFAPADRST